MRPAKMRVLSFAPPTIIGGLLFIGHSENLTEHRDLVELVGKTAYRRVGKAA